MLRLLWQQSQQKSGRQIPVKFPDEKILSRCRQTVTTMPDRWLPAKQYKGRDAEL
jgi:hypothetical protein